MTLFEELPKEIEENQFDSFLDKIQVEFPINEYPELFVHYQKVNHKLLILAIGKSNQCAEQMVKAYEKRPSLQAQRSNSLMLRAPKTKFLLRRVFLCR
jgi:poly(A) polymerase Pap1